MPERLSEEYKQLEISADRPYASIITTNVDSSMIDSKIIGNGSKRIENQDVEYSCLENVVAGKGEVTERATPPKIHAKVNAIVNKNVRSSVVENNAQLGTGQNCCIHAEDITRAILNQTVQTGENQGSNHTAMDELKEEFMKAIQKRMLDNLKKG